MTDVRIASIGTAVPPLRITQEHAVGLVRAHYAGELSGRSMEVMTQVLAHPSIRTRHVSFSNELEMLSLKNEDPDRRIERFSRWSVRLSAEAIEQALEKAGLSVKDVSCLVVNTCTGYLCPGVSTYLIEHLGLSHSIRAYDLVGSGCGGALPNLQAGAQYLAAEPAGVAVCVSAEICSATWQMGNDMSLLISNAIFGDGAAAAVLWTRPAGVRMRDFATRFEPRFREDVRYVYKNGQLHNQLSVQLPKVVRGVVPPMVKELLAVNGLSISDIRRWAVHPGGDRMVVALQEELGLSDELMAPTRKVLRDFGNMSSPTVLFILKDIMDGGVGKGETILMTAFGAGMSAFACLLEG